MEERFFKNQGKRENVVSECFVKERKQGDILQDCERENSRETEEKGRKGFMRMSRHISERYC